MQTAALRCLSLLVLLQKRLLPSAVTPFDSSPPANRTKTLPKSLWGERQKNKKTTTAALEGERNVSTVT